MDDRNTPKEWKKIALVPTVGACGGLLLWLWQELSNPDPDHKLKFFSAPYLTLPAFMLLGAGSAFVFVYLVTITDRKDTARLLALALLSGFAWEPIWESAQDRIVPSQEFSRPKVARELQKITEEISTSKIAEDIRIREQRENEQPEATARALVDSLSRHFVQLYDVDIAEEEFQRLPLLEFEKDQAGNYEQYRIHLKVQQTILIDIETQENKDLIATLYRYSGGEVAELITTGDDFEDSLDPQLRADDLDAGDYLLVLNVFGTEDDVGKAKVSLKSPN